MWGIGNLHPKIVRSIVESHLAASNVSPAEMASKKAFFFNDTATTEIYTLSLHDALPTWCRRGRPAGRCTHGSRRRSRFWTRRRTRPDRKSTRLNSSHQIISYAVFCLKKKKTTNFTIYIKQKKKIQ